MDDKDVIFKLLDIVEGIIQTDEQALTNEDLEDYIVSAVYAHKHYGRKAPLVSTINDNLEGIHIGDLVQAGLTYEDFKATTRL